MGMFDTIWMDCPRCGNRLEFQSKTGACTLAEYDQCDVPTAVAVGADGDTETCACGAVWTFRVPSRVVPMLISEKQEPRR